MDGECANCLNDCVLSSIRRGLCPSCYRNRTIRRKFGALPVAAEATDALPGSAEKIRVMSERAAKGLSIFHPGDAEIWVDAWLREDRNRSQQR